MIDSRQCVAVVRLGATAKKRLSRIVRPQNPGRGQKMRKKEGLTPVLYPWRQN